MGRRRFLKRSEYLKRKKWKRKQKLKNNVDINFEDASPVMQNFLNYSYELDSRHDKHERIVKISRDITVDSKRTIFLLQRLASQENDNSNLLKEAEDKLKEIQQKRFKVIAKELQGEDPYQFIRAYTAGLQEYIEAVSFFCYIKGDNLVQLSTIQEDLTFSESVASDDCTNSNHSTRPHISKVFVPQIDYMLGVLDLTGELMRLAINSVGAGDLDTPFKICVFLQEMRRNLESLSYMSREMGRKMSALRQSLQKVERACYTLKVRGSEIPKHMLADVFTSSGATEPMVFQEDIDLGDD